MERVRRSDDVQAFEDAAPALPGQQHAADRSRAQRVIDTARRITMRDPRIDARAKGISLGVGDGCEETLCTSGYLRSWSAPLLPRRSPAALDPPASRPTWLPHPAPHARPVPRPRSDHPHSAERGRRPAVPSPPTRGEGTRSVAGILVTHWSDDTAPVTVLVRTKAGSDQAAAGRCSSHRSNCRLFEFPDIVPGRGFEVLVTDQHPTVLSQQTRLVWHWGELHSKIENRPAPCWAGAVSARKLITDAARRWFRNKSTADSDASRARISEIGGKVAWLPYRY